MTPPPGILLIEDDPAQRLLLAAYLRQDGLAVVEAGTLAEAHSRLETRPDLVLLDLTLPDGDGLDLARSLVGRGVPVLVVTCRPGDQLRALELGADDFVCKPYDPRELLARIRNLLRRCGRPSQPLAMGAYRLDPQGRRLLDPDGAEVALTRGEFDLLEALCAARGRVLSRGYLADVLNPEGDGGGRSVDVLVSRLRRKLADDPRRPGLLQTVPGVGYRLRA